MSKKINEPVQEVVFACNSSTNLCECHGMEIAIGTLTNENLAEITMLVEEGMYLESVYFSNWYQFDNVFHDNGVFLDEVEVEDLDDKNSLSTSNFELGEVVFSDVKLKNKFTYLCTFRNETIYNVSKGLVSGKGKKLLDCEVSTFGFLEKLADINVSILKLVSVNGEMLERNSADEEDSGEIYDTNQFLIKNGKIVFYASNGSGQYPFYLDDKVPQLNSETDKRTADKILNLLGMDISLKKTTKNDEVQMSIKKVTLNPNFYSKLKGDLKNNKNIALAAVTGDGMALSIVNKIFRADAEVVLASIKAGGSFAFADISLKSDVEFVKKIIAINVSAIKYISDELKNNKEIAIASVGSSASTIKYLNKKFWSDHDVLKVLLTTGLINDSNPTILEFIPQKYRDNKELVLELLKKNGYELKFVSDRLKEDYECLLAACLNTHFSLRYCPLKLLSDFNFFIKLLNDTKKSNILQFFSDQIKDNEEALLECAKYDYLNSLEGKGGAVIKFASDRLKNSKAFIINFIEIAPFVLNFISRELVNDREIKKIAKKF